MTNVILKCRYCGVKKEAHTSEIELKEGIDEARLTNLKCYNCGAQPGIYIKAVREDGS